MQQFQSASVTSTVCATVLCLHNARRDSYCPLEAICWLGETDVFVLQGCKWMAVATPFLKGLIKLRLNPAEHDPTAALSAFGSAHCAQVSGESVWELGWAGAQYGVLADVMLHPCWLCLCVMHDLLLPHHVAPTVFSMDFSMALKHPFLQHLCVKIS